jgi:DNA-binding NarL/FixJ family response regulator
VTDRRVQAALTHVQAAAYDPSRWDDALRAVAGATGSRIGQLIGVGGPTGTRFNRIPDADPDFLRDWDAHGCSDPAVNSRVRIGSRAPILHSLDERSFTTELDGRRTPVYGDLIAKADIPFICLTNLVSEPNLHVGLAVLRGRSQGNIEGDDRRIFDMLAREVRQSVLTAMQLGVHSARAVVKSLEALQAIAFVCDSSGRVLTCTAAACDMLTVDDRLELKGGRLLERATGRDLSDRARAAAAGDPAAAAPLVLRTSKGPTPLVLETSALPAEVAGFSSVPGVLLIAHGGRISDADRLRRRFGIAHDLTPRESEVAIALCHGLSPQTVAARMNIGLSTVRTYIRRLFEKTGTDSLTQLVTLLLAYGGA